MRNLKDKILESLTSILPIGLIVLVLSATITPMDPGNMLLFLLGFVFLVIGMSLFNMGAEMSMQPLGTKIGSTIASSGKIWIIAFVSFIIGIAVTVSEPDLQILAEQVFEGNKANQWLLILTVSIGVGIFLLIALLRIVFGVSLNLILIVFYVTAFVISFFLPESFRPLAFDSGGVTTGPMTVPFIMSIGAGVSSARVRNGGRNDSFGITALCSIGPIISVLVYGLAAKVSFSDVEHSVALESIDTTRESVWAFCKMLPDYAKEVAIALLPIAVFTVFFQLLARAFSKTQLIRIGIGVIYTFVGLAIFLTGANVGFMPIGRNIGESLASIGGGYLLIPIGMLLGYFIVKAEPAVYVLNRLVEEMSAGAISGKTTGLGLSIGVAVALGLSAIRILTGISIMYILIPGYVIALTLCFFVPKIFVGIAFDSGGVASGTMMSGFVLPLAIGACTTLGGDVMTDAYGCVAFVAMAPIISIQVLGLIYSIKSKHRKHSFINKNETFVEYTVERRGDGEKKAKQ
ncbi:MAG: DUF1538 domain-containing protein [Clostridia bacterium]|nr:DUF1538 domain-containing protein [Clostridia bacterium]